MTTDSNPECQVCQTLLKAATAYLERQQNNHNTSPDQHTEWKLGRFEDLISDKDCPHRELFQCVTSRRGSFPNRTITLSLTKTSFRLFAELPNPDHGVSVWSDLLVIPPSTSPEIQGACIGRHLDPTLINFEMINTWKQTCSQHHGPECSLPTLKLPTPISYLIDTHQHCLVPGQNKPYVALSYVWGQTPMPKTTILTLPLHTQPGAFLKTSLPATILDAISFAPLLKERYLWLDSLCIVQDDLSSLNTHISQMATIFNNATLTIIAADGCDASNGLSRVSSSRPRSLLLPHLKLANSDITLTPRRDLTLDETRWAARGWTLQESLFSRRKLSFVDGSARWACSRSLRFEDVNSPLPARQLDWPGEINCRESHNDFIFPLLLNQLGSLSASVPNLSTYASIVSSYTNRSLRFDSDAIKAIRGTLNFLTLSGGFGRGFIWGIPVSCLDAGLLWRAGEGKLTPRTAAPNKENGGNGEIPPRWSWAAYKGGTITSEVLRDGTLLKDGEGYAGDDPFPVEYSVLPFLEWETRDEKDEAKGVSRRKRVGHQNEWSEWRRKYMGRREGLPSGWVYVEDDKEDVEREKRQRRGREGKWWNVARHRDDRDSLCKVKLEDMVTGYYYTCSGVEDKKFWFPVPFGSGLVVGEVMSKERYGRYLCAKTRRAKMWGARPRRNLLFEDELGHHRQWGMEAVPIFGTVVTAKTVIRDGIYGEEVGEIEADTEEDERLLGGTDENLTDRVESEEEEEAGYPIDLVATSRGFDFVEPRAAEDETYTFYNVLWVDWVDGVAYRRGVGRVKAVVWEAAEREEVDLVLG
ncbi:heterokaryon incompatibility protein-domain-containing protein [Cladorrhinum sp. PSN332]|nr:heterokaryon incompatibility protein-domain-containing protein [Cladorrhinum sp. PSN332]